MSTLALINPDVKLEANNCDITSNEGYERLKEAMEKCKCDLVLCCVDNYAARMTVNKLCN